MKTRKNQACQNQGSVFNLIMTPVKTINMTQNQREERRTSLGQCGERRPTLPLSAIPGGYRNPLVFTLGAQAAETWCPNHGQGTPSGGSGEVVSPWRLWKCVPRYRVWGLCGSHPIHVGRDPVYTEAVYLLCACSVSCHLGDSQHLN